MLSFIILACSKPATEASALFRAERPPPLNLSFVGDIMAHPPNFNMSNYDRIYRAVSPILLSDDLSFANLEFVVDNQRPMSGYPRFNVHTAYVEAALRGGFDVFSTANNHSNDYGKLGVLQTQHSLRGLSDRQDSTPLLDQYLDQYQLPFYYSGLRRAKDGKLHIQSIHHRGWHIAFLAVTGTINEYNAGVDYINYVPMYSKVANNELRELVKSRRANYDLFILSYHGGIEYQLEPNREKQQLFASLMEAGVDILWGHHPHVLQPVERYVRASGRSGLIMYSLGNFISSQPWYLTPADWQLPLAYTGDSAIIQLNIRMTTEGATVKYVELLPITHLQHFDFDGDKSDGDKSDSDKSNGDKSDGDKSDGDKSDGAKRDGFEVLFTRNAEAAAAPAWKTFYRERARIMHGIIEASSPHYDLTHPLIP